MNNMWNCGQRDITLGDGPVMLINGHFGHIIFNGPWHKRLETLTWSIMSVITPLNHTVVVLCYF